MRLDLDRGPHGLVVTVTLSRRNVLALAHKLDWEGSARELWNTDVWVDGQPVRGIGFRARCEPDHLHYGRRPDPPGPMHPRTEQSIAEHDRAAAGARARESADEKGAGGDAGSARAPRPRDPCDGSPGPTSNGNGPHPDGTRRGRR